MILFTRPDHDSLTNYLKIWTNDLVKRARNLGKVSTVDLVGKKANRKKFEGYLKSSTNKNFICFNGHGNENFICGFDDEKLLVRDDFDIKRKINVVYARSCRVGGFLGGFMVRFGVKSFVGYDADFVVYMRKDCALKPLKDDLAKKFIGPSNHLISQLLKNKTVNSANEKSKQIMKKEMINLLSSGNKEDLNIATYLYSNLIHQVVLGNGDCSIFT
jgi:hypothetical protein